MEGPMTPGNLGPEIIKLLESLKIMGTNVFSTWKRCASRFCEGSTERQLQIIDMELFGANCVLKIGEKVSKVLKFDQFWKVRRVIGWLQTG